jgi:rhodanese-related sulfurtransferase
MHPGTIPEITAAEAAQQVRAGTYLLDVRERHEWDAGHAPEAVHIAMSELNARAGEIPTEVPVICVCHVGGRSAAVADALNRAGWNAVNLLGGMAAWQADGLPVVDAEGNPGRVI